MTAPSNIIIFCRYENTFFRLNLGRHLREMYPGVPIVFMTLYSWSHRQIQAAGETSIYMLDVMRKMSGDELSDEDMQSIDREVYDATGANINLMLLSERGLPRDAVKAHAFRYRHLALLDQYIGKGTLTIHETCDSYVYWLAGSMAIARGGWNFAFIACAIPGNSVLAKRTAWTTWVNPESSNKDLNLADIRDELSKPIEERMTYKRVGKARHFGLWLRYQTMVLKYNLIDAWHGAYYYAFKDYVPAALYKTWCLLRKRIPVPYTIRSAEEVQACDSKFIYFPLQVEPEASILCYSPWFRDQLEAARILSQSLPLGWKLLIKENHYMLGLRKRSFYRKLLALPDVELVDIQVPTFVLLSKASAVAGVAGTANFEARILGKMSVTLGSPPFHHLVSSSDVGGRLRLRELFDRLDRSDTIEPLSDEEFDQWKLSTFEAYGSMYWQEAYRGLDASDENVEKYARFIAQVLRDPQHTDLNGAVIRDSYEAN